MATRQQNGTVYFAYLVSKEKKTSKEFPDGYIEQKTRGYAIVRDEHSPDGYSSAATADGEMSFDCAKSLKSKRNMETIRSLFVEEPFMVELGEFDIADYGGTMRGAYVGALEAIKTREA